MFGESLQTAVVMDSRIIDAAEIVKLMDAHLRSELLKRNGVIQKKKLWENTYSKHQIDKRNDGAVFSLQDHIRGMVYSMLSAGIVWARVESGIDEASGRIAPIDDIFVQYDVDRLMELSPQKLRDGMKGIKCASTYTLKQMGALLEINIGKLAELQRQYGDIDAYYQTLIEEEESLKSLVAALSLPHTKYKFSQMGEALVAEYLKNVGYDIAKPDRHIRRILGKRCLGCSDAEAVPIYDVFDIVTEIASVANMPSAEVDYILWSYCATGFGEICTKENPKCEICVGNKICYKRRNHYETTLF